MKRPPLNLLSFHCRTYVTPANAIRIEEYCAKAPLINGTVRLSSRGIGASSTRPAMRAAAANTQLNSVIPATESRLNANSDTPANAKVPIGDLPRILGPGMGRPTSAATGSPSDKKSSTATAIGLSNKRKQRQAAIKRNVAPVTCCASSRFSNTLSHLRKKRLSQPRRKRAMSSDRLAMARIPVINAGRLSGRKMATTGIAVPTVA